ncbi:MULTISPECIES: MFS transporter [unclassified Arthrobacter]|uniref:MFS transporter n=1 Tax=unclassified Arthrobacter TaxID=235627 RepID=UPI0024DF4663|nr:MULTISPECIES: MFS transporter [unclassified Arthrobacter]MCC9145296.1 MFS transporter [Arthrobacter sp. zg-Y919]MDK1276524.1 MFS transporter [Arthrobacter sp. zg.Y919]WIB01882.1 MFS transporter [Arthrobacter sp. zg-Y919]
MAGSGQKLWSKGFVLAIITNLFISMVFYLLMTTMALYTVKEFSASDGAAGFASGSFVLGALVARVFAGKFLDFVGRRRLLVASLAVFVVASLLYVPASNLALLLTVRILHGAAFGAASTSLSASVMGLIPANRRGEGTGYFGISTTLATAVGPFLAVMLVDSVSYRALFLFAAGCAAVALVLSLVLRLPERTPTPEEQKTKWRMHLTDIIDPAALAIASVMFIAGAAYAGILSFLNSYAQSEGLVLGASLFFVVYAVVVLVSRLFVGRLQDRHGDNAVVYPTLVSFAAGMALLAYAPNDTVLALAGVFVGFGFGALMPCAQAIAVTMAAPTRIGLATSTFFILMDAGVGLGPLLLGLLLPLTGFHGMYWVLAAVLLASTGLYHLVHGRKNYRPGAAVEPAAGVPAA